MIIAIIKIIGSIISLIIVALFCAYILSNQFQKPSTTLFKRGYLLSHPERDAVAFLCPKKANEFANRARKKGVRFNIYAIWDGDIKFCGDTSTTIIT